MKNHAKTYIRVLEGHTSVPQALEMPCRLGRANASHGLRGAGWDLPRSEPVENTSRSYRLRPCFDRTWRAPTELARLPGRKCIAAKFVVGHSCAPTISAAIVPSHVTVSRSIRQHATSNSDASPETSVRHQTRVTPKTNNIACSKLGGRDMLLPPKGSGQ